MVIRFREEVTEDEICIVGEPDDHEDEHHQGQHEGCLKFVKFISILALVFTQKPKDWIDFRIFNVEETIFD